MKGFIINKKIKYNYILLDLHNFVKWIQENKKIRKSIEKIISIHRDQVNFKIINLIYEAFEDIENNKNTYYFFIYKNNEIITSCRLIIDNKKNFYMNMVHTNINYRNLGFCKKNISKIISLMKYKCTKIILDVDKNNKNAIKCYISSGFIFSKINKKSNDYRMIFYYK
jgi:hypothetical protein